jgi:ferredoxin-NADP reductase
MLATGSVIVGLIIVQLGLFVFRNLQTVRGEALRQELALELLRQQIQAANAQRIRREQTHFCWNGYRKFVVEKKVEEALNTCSFYLAPHDKKPLPLFEPGQYLTFRINISGQEKPVVRCYSLSDKASSEYYRITIKRVPAPSSDTDVPAGLVSNYFHDHIEESDILDVQAPRGNFTLDLREQRPTVLIAGGVGVTPMLSMAFAAAESDARMPIYFFYGVRNGKEHAMKQTLHELNTQYEHIRVFNCYSHPSKDDVEGRDYDFDGRVSVDLMKDVLGSNNYQYYICGPPPMMSSLLSDLKEWGVPKQDVHTEAFEASTIKKVVAAQSEPPDETKPADAEAKKKLKVTFSRSKKTLAWDESAGNLLDFALANGVQIESGCRAGNCATCVVAITSGLVSSVAEHCADTEEGTCLTCISIPQKDLVLDS